MVRKWKYQNGMLLNYSIVVKKAQIINYYKSNQEKNIVLISMNIIINMYKYYNKSLVF